MIACLWDACSGRWFLYCFEIIFASQIFNISIKCPRVDRILSSSYICDWDRTESLTDVRLLQKKLKEEVEATAHSLSEVK